MNIKIQPLVIYFGLLCWLLSGSVAAKPNVVLLGLQGQQAEKVKQNLHQILEKNQSIVLKPLNFTQSTVQTLHRKRVQQREKKQTIHQNLADAKKQYQNLQFDAAQTILANVLEQYEKHLFTQDIVDGIATAYFYQALTHLALKEKQSAQASMFNYHLIQQGMITSSEHAKDLSKKIYAPDIQDLFKQAQKNLKSQSLASLSFVSSKAIEKVWINGLGIAYDVIEQQKLYAGQHYIVVMDKKGQPLFSQRLQLNPGNNIISIQTASHKATAQQQQNYFAWDREKQVLSLNAAQKKIIAEMALKHTIDIFIFLSSTAQGVFASFFDERNGVLLPAFMLKDAQDILNYSKIAIGENGYLNQNIDMTLLQRRRWSIKNEKSE